MDFLKNLLTKISKLNVDLPKPKQPNTPNMPTIKVPQPVNKPKVYGTHGRIEIPSLRIGIPLNDADNANSQYIVDRKDSAACMKAKNYMLIADHSGQDGFERLGNVIPHTTVAYIDMQTYKERYVCIRKQVGHILIGEKNKLVDANYNPISEHDLVMYTCIKRSARNVMDVWLTYWKRL